MNIEEVASTFVRDLLLFDIRRILGSLEFESLAAKGELKLASMTIEILSEGNCSWCRSVLEAANTRGDTVFTEKDMEEAEAELSFALKPADNPMRSPFSRVDAWFARVNGTYVGVIGLAIFHTKRHSCWITWYATRPGNLRLGSLLMALAVSVADSRGFTTLQVWTGSKFAGTIQVYERFGFKKCNLIPPELENEGDVTSLERSLDDVVARYPLQIKILRGPDNPSVKYAS